MTKEVIETNWGIANTYEDRIEINKELVNYPELRAKIIKHENEHANVKKKGIGGFMKDRKIDALTELTFWEMFKFSWRRPKTWIQYLPITYSKRDDTIYFDWSLMILYSVFFFTFYLPSRFIINNYGLDLFSKVVPLAILILAAIFIIKNLTQRLFKKINEEYAEAESKSKRKFTEVSRKKDKQLQKFLKK